MEPRGYRMVVSTDLEYVQACGVACGHLGAGPGGLARPSVAAPKSRSPTASPLNFPFKAAGLIIEMGQERVPAARLQKAKK